MLMNKDTVSAVFLLLMSLFTIGLSLRMSLWGDEGPNEGFFPFILGILLFSFSIALLIISKIKSGENPDASTERGDRKRLLQYLVAILFYAISLENLGYILTSILFFLAVLKFVEKRGYLISLLLTLAAVSLSFFLFKTLLGVPLPTGIMKYL